ncbi:EamA family transporter, partial [Streptomyces brasiliscabiei]
GNLAAYGVLIGAGQFGMLFTAMRHDITPGLASLVVQTQVFFTIGLSMRLTGERIAPFQIVALLLATAGLAVIVLHTDGTATPLGL